MNNLTISSLFEPEPNQWGLRGDPWLWREMKKNCQKKTLPKSEEAFMTILLNQFEKLTGFPIDVKKIIVVSRYKKGGLSNGGVSTKFWKERAIPLLLLRYLKIKRVKR